MKTMLIVFHSLTGGTRQMAEAAARGGAAQAGIQVDLVEASKAGAADVLHADGYIFATPENLAAMAGMMKDFFDRTYYDALDRIGGRPYAILVCAGSDGQNAVRHRSSASRPVGDCGPSPIRSSSARMRRHRKPFLHPSCFHPRISAAARSWVRRSPPA